MSLDEADDDSISLVSQSGTKHKTTRSTCAISKHLHIVMSNDKSAKEIELATVPDEVLERILFYMTYHTTNGKTPDQIKEIAKPIRSLEMAKIVDDPEDAKFVDEMTYKQIFDCILAANYMQIDQLLHLLSAKVATLIKNKSHEEIRTIFQEGARATSASARAQS